MNQEIKEQAHKEFDEKFREFAPDGSDYGAGLRIKHTGTIEDREILDNVHNFIDSLIDKTVQMERDRIIEEINKMFHYSEPSMSTDSFYLGKDNAFRQVITLITNNSDINKYKE